MKPAEITAPGQSMVSVLSAWSALTWFTGTGQPAASMRPSAPTSRLPPTYMRPLLMRLPRSSWRVPLPETVQAAGRPAYAASQTSTG